MSDINMSISNNEIPTVSATIENKNTNNQTSESEDIPLSETININSALSIETESILSKEEEIAVNKINIVGLELPNNKIQSESFIVVKEEEEHSAADSDNNKRKRAARIFVETIVDKSLKNKNSKSKLNKRDDLKNENLDKQIDKLKQRPQKEVKELKKSQPKIERAATSKYRGIGKPTEIILNKCSTTTNTKGKNISRKSFVNQENIKHKINDPTNTIESYKAFIKTPIEAVRNPNFNLKRREARTSSPNWNCKRQQIREIEHKTTIVESNKESDSQSIATSSLTKSQISRIPVPTQTYLKNFNYHHSSSLNKSPCKSSSYTVSSENSILK